MFPVSAVMLKNPELYDFVKITIEHELVEELDFLANYDRTRQAVQEIVDMPDRLIDLFFRLCLHNNGRLTANRRESHFGFLTDDEVAGMETPSGKVTRRTERQICPVSRTAAYRFGFLGANGLLRISRKVRKSNPTPLVSPDLRAKQNRLLF